MATRKAVWVAAADDSHQRASRDLEAIRQRAGGPAAISNNGLSALTEDHDRIARELNDTLVHQLFTVSLDLHSALSRIDHNTDGDTDDHHAAEKIRHAITGLDQAINHLRDGVIALNDP